MAGYDFSSEYAASLYRVFWKSIVAAAISVQLLQTLRYWYWEHEYQLMRKAEKAAIKEQERIRAEEEAYWEAYEAGNTYDFSAWEEAGVSL